MRIATEYVVTFDTLEDIKTLIGVCKLAQLMISHRPDLDVAEVAPGLDMKEARSMIDTILGLESEY